MNIWGRALKSVHKEKEELKFPLCTADKNTCAFEECIAVYAWLVL